MSGRAPTADLEDYNQHSYPAHSLKLLIESREGGNKTYLELAHRLDILDTQLKHVQNPSVEHPGENQIMRSLLGVQARDEQARVVLLSEEFERRGRFKRVDVVLPRKVDSSGAFKSVLL